MAVLDVVKRGTVATLRRTPPRVTRGVPVAAVRRRLLGLHAEVLRVHPVPFDRAPTPFGFVLGGTTADLLQRNVYLHGIWEPNISRWVPTHLRPGDVVVDVGANVGWFSLLAARCVGPDGLVVAFEPVPTIVAALRANLARNAAASVQVHPVAAADEPGSTEIFRGAPGNLGVSATVGGGDRVSEGTVAQVRGADVVDPALWRRVRLVKVDTEGDDLRALRGLEAVLRAMPAGAAALVEVTPEDLAERGQTPADLVGFMRDAGFDRMLAVENSYEIDDYVREVPAAPVPLHHAPSTKVDVIFLKG